MTNAFGKWLRIMRITSLLIFIVSLHASASGLGQTVTIKVIHQPIASVITDITRQADVSVVYDEAIFANAKPVTVELNNVTAEEAIKTVLANQPYLITVRNNKIFIARAVEKTPRLILETTPPIDVRGRVVNEKGEPAVGVTVEVKGTKRATSTDNNGEFILNNIDGKATLIISGANIENYEVRVNDKAIINATVTQKVSDLDETVVVAYGKTTQRANTGAVTVVKGEQIATLPNRSFDKSLQGLVPGLQISNGTGQPGGGLSNIVLRGIGTGTEALNGSTIRNPLFVIDGVPVSQEKIQITQESMYITPISNPLAQLNPMDIESVSILKDAAAIALYGAKAANGVVLVTTKKGKAGKTKYSFSHQADFARRIKGKVKVLNQEEYLTLLYEAYKNSDPVAFTDSAISADLFGKFANYTNSSGAKSFYPAPDWFDYLYDNNAMTLSNNFSITGGDNKNKFFLNLEYTSQDGIIKKTGYDRASLRFNYENRAGNWFKMGINSTFSYNLQKFSTNGESSFTPGALAYSMSPLNPVYDTLGNYILDYRFGASPVGSPNPIASANYNINRNTAYRGLMSINLEMKFLKRFIFSTVAGADFMLAEAKEKIDPRIRGGSILPGVGSIQDRDLRRISLINTNILHYNISSSDQSHNLGILAGQESQIFYDKVLYVWMTGLKMPYYEQVSNATTVRSISGALTRQTLLSFFTQATYNYKNKYFASASVRRDGSSKFGNAQRYGNYWSVGAGWDVSSEKFVKSSVSWIDYLKLRASIGSAGNSGAINALTKYDQLVILNFSGADAAVPITTPGNPDIRWESVLNTNLGIDMAMFRNKVSITADIYTRKISNLIYKINLPGVSGFEDVLSNIGDMQNKGTELSVNLKIIDRKSFKWDFNINWSSNVNKLVSTPFAQSALVSYNFINKVGENFNSFYLPVWAGVNENSGLPQWLDSTHKVTSDVNLAAPQIVGKPQPDGYGAITNSFVYNRFTFSMMFYYQYGFKILDEASMGLQRDGRLPYTNQSVLALTRWQKPGDKTNVPRNVLDNSDGGSVASTRYLFDGDFIRLKNVSLTYSFPANRILHGVFDRFDLLLQANNLFTITKFKGLDPDNINVSGSNGFAYPQQTSFSVGLNLNF